MAACRIGLTSELMDERGNFTFPDYSLGSLSSNPAVEVVRIPYDENGQLRFLDRLDIFISIPSSDPVTPDLLDCAHRLTAIVRVGTGYDDVDIEACTKAEVALIAPNGVTRRPTAVAALTLILALATKLIQKHRLSTQGDAAWSQRAKLRGVDLEGCRLGLIGCGQIGQELIRISKPLGLEYLVADPAISEEGARLIGARLMSLEDVLRQADFVSIHCPLTTDTWHLLNAERLSWMKESAFLVNTARGPIVDQDALLETLESSRIAGAGLDVFEPEPLPAGHPLTNLENVVLSAHALNWTCGLDRNFGASNAESITSLLEGTAPQGIVNTRVLDSKGFQAKLANLARTYRDVA